MDANTIPTVQLPLFTYGEPAANIEEVFPILWNAMESLTCADTGTRQRGLDALLEVSAHKISPLVAYVIATCLADPDVYIRRRVTFILAEIIAGEPGSKKVSEEVRRVVTGTLHSMGEEVINGLLEVSVMDAHADQAIYHLLNACPYAGRDLGEIVTEWKNALPIRQKAVYFIGLVGYLEALPVLEKLYTRLEARQSGQYTMAFAPPSIKADNDLLPFLRIAIEQLNAR